MRKSWKSPNNDIPLSSSNTNGYLQNGATTNIPTTMTITDEPSAAESDPMMEETVPLATVVHLGGAGAVTTNVITTSPKHSLILCNNLSNSGGAGGDNNSCSENSGSNNKTYQRNSAIGNNRKKFIYLNTREWCLLISVFVLLFITIICLLALTEQTMSCRNPPGKLFISIISTHWAI